MKCNICGNETIQLFEGLVLNKYQVKYYSCPNCEFIQTEKPYWLKEAYNNAITDLDVGLVRRNLNYSLLIEDIIKRSFNYGGKFLDYAGGYGLFVRLMRDKGFDFYREDKYCENIFADHFDIRDTADNSKFEVVTAFEVFEHLDKPLKDIERMLNYADTLIFSTELQPKVKLQSVDDWWYFAPETGQHISFYTVKTLKYIADKYNLFFYSHESLHLLSKKKFAKNPLVITGDQVGEIPHLTGLTDSDLDIAREYIKRTSGNKKNTDLTFVKSDKATLEERLDLVYAELAVKEKDISDTRVKLDTAVNELGITRTQLETTSQQLIAISNQFDLVNNEIARMRASRSWRISSVVSRFLARLLPMGSTRRHVAVIPFKILRKIYRGFKRVRAKALEYIFLGEILAARLKPKKKRHINKSSKKLVYIGHSYHNKTKSTEFLTEYLKKFYDVTLILDESWRGEGDAYPDLSFIDESYLGVIFFQNLPSREIVSAVKNDNIIFFPMYDASSGLGYDFWRNWRDLKIMNFSKTLHKKLTKWGFESDFVQYFPKPGEFIKGSKDEVFFWQRLTKISINEAVKLFGSAKVKIHLHRAIDPVQQYIPPSMEIEKKYNITYSDWFKTRGEMLDTIKQKAIYVAPREFEGIGMSFLEAMAMGKAVIAVNNPTMNEYIVNGKTGYLFDLAKPKQIDLSNIEEVQANTYKYMCDGYEKWQKDIHRIIDFIEK